MMDTWRSWVAQGWEAVTMKPGQETSETISYDPESEALTIKGVAYNPRTGVAHVGRRPKCHIEAGTDGGQLVLDERIDRPCVFLVKRRKASGQAEPVESEDEDEDEDQAENDDKAEDTTPAKS